MKIVAALCVVVQLLLVSPAVSQAPDDKLIVPGVRIGRFTLAMSVEEIRRLNGRGAAAPLDEDPCSAYVGRVFLHSWLRGMSGVTVDLGAISRDGSAVLALTTGDETFKTQQEIGSGVPGDKVIAVHGAPTGRNIIASTGVAILVYDEIGATFTIRSSLVGAVWVFRVRAGTTIWNLQTPAPAAQALSTGEGIYVVDGGNNRIVRFTDMSGSGWTALGSKGSGVGHFDSPSGIYVDTGGRIYVADIRNSRIVRMNDITGAGWVALGTKGLGARQFDSDSGLGLWVDADGRIYVVEDRNRRVVRMDDMTGAGWTSLGDPLCFPCDGRGQFQFPKGIFVDAGRRIYVADSGNNRIVRMNDMRGSGWAELRGSGPNQFDGPTSVFADSAGRIYVTDRGNHRIVRIDDMTGAGWMALGTRGGGPNQFRNPWGIFVDSGGRIYVTDDYRVSRMNDMTGSGWTTFGCRGSGPNEFNMPGVTAGIAGIYVR